MTLFAFTMFLLSVATPKVMIIMHMMNDDDNGNDEDNCDDVRQD